MLGAQRHATILHVLRTRGAATCAELGHRLAVSEVTVRRDLHLLAARGLVVRVHGGAVPAGPSTGPARDAATEAARTREYQAIAEHAAGLVRPGMTVGLAAGPLGAVIARSLAPLAHLTIVTNSLPIAAALARAGTAHTVHVIGGVTTATGAQVGPMAIAGLRHFAADLLFLDPYGMHPATGYTAADLQEAATDQGMLAVADRTVVTAHHRTWHRVGVGRIAALSRADLLVTSTLLEPAAREELEASTPAVFVDP